MYLINSLCKKVLLGFKNQYFFLFNYIRFGHEVCTELQDAIWSPSWIKTIALLNEAYTKEYTSSSILTIWNDKIRLLGKIFFPIFLTVSKQFGWSTHLPAQFTQR